VVTRHRDCGQPVHVELRCAHNHRVKPNPGPGPAWLACRTASCDGLGRIRPIQIQR
jgi:hypothetical protein